MSTTDIPVGAILVIDMSGYHHYGIYMGNGHVAHNSKQTGMVCIEPLHSFLEGKPLRYQAPEQPVQADLLFEKIIPKLGEKYSLFSNNCEHFVSSTTNDQPSSSQVNAVAIGAILGLAYGFISNRPLQQVISLAVSGAYASIALQNSITNSKLRSHTNG
ncbi:MAG: lecithin retinol acyltransferase family protein [Rhodospirillales bacterium]